MANFDSVNQGKRESGEKAIRLIDQVRGSYQSAKAVQFLLALYTANTDATFTASANAFYSAAERAEMASVASAYNAFITALEAHPEMVGLPPTGG